MAQIVYGPPPPSIYGLVGDLLDRHRAQQQQDDQDAISGLKAVLAQAQDSGQQNAIIQQWAQANPRAAKRIGLGASFSVPQSAAEEQKAAQLQAQKDAESRLFGGGYAQGAQQTPSAPSQTAFSASVPGLGAVGNAVNQSLPSAPQSPLAGASTGSPVGMRGLMDLISVMTARNGGRTPSKEEITYALTQMTGGDAGLKGAIDRETGAEMNAYQTATTGETNRHNVVDEGQLGALRDAQGYQAQTAGVKNLAGAQNEYAQVGFHNAQTNTEVQKTKPGSGYEQVQRNIKGASGTADADIVAQAEQIMDPRSSYHIGMVSKDKQGQVLSYIKQRGGVPLTKDQRKDVVSYVEAKGTIDKIREDIDAITNADNLFDKALAVAKLKTDQNAFSIKTGRALGENGRFTDQDRPVYARLFSPGAFVALADPDRAKAWLNNFNAWTVKMRQKKFGKYDSLLFDANGDIRDTTATRDAGASSSSNDDPLGINQ